MQHQTPIKVTTTLHSRHALYDLSFRPDGPLNEVDTLRYSSPKPFLIVLRDPDGALEGGRPLRVGGVEVWVGDYDCF